MSHVFVSYSRSNMQAVDGKLRKVVSRLRQNFNIWLDKTDIVPGTNFKDALHEAVKTSQVVVFFMSRASVESDWCKAELSAAQAANIPIVPYVYEEAPFPFGIADTNAIMSYKEPNSIEKLENALRKLAPDTYIHGTFDLIDKQILHNPNKTFAEAATEVKNTIRFIVDMSGDEITLVGLPLTTTSYCTSYIVGRATDELQYKKTIQLGLQFSGVYRNASFPIQIAKHFFSKHGIDFSLRLILVYGPPQIVYDQRRDSVSLMHVLDMPTENDNPWLDAVSAVKKSLRSYHIDRDAPDLQIFMQGPVAGIAYELGSSHRDLHYHSEHYTYERNEKQYYRILGSLN